MVWVSVLFYVLSFALSIAGIICFFTGVHVVLYVAAVFAILFALQRIPKGDAHPLFGIILSALLAIPMCFLYNSAYLPTAAMFICAEDLYSNVKSAYIMFKYL